MDNLTYLKNALRKHSLIFSAISTPLLLTSSGYSGFVMQKELGFSYGEFLYNIQRGWGEMFYLSEDYKRLWLIIKEKINQDPDYLVKIKKQYEENFRKYLKLFTENKSKDLSVLSNWQLHVMRRLYQEK